MAAKLKVFTWSDGFHAFTVATSSRPRALEAWGSKQDLFATGLASQLSGGPDYEAALASPGEVVERGLAIDVGKIGKAKLAKPRGPSKAKAAKIEKLQAALADLDERHQAVMADFEEQQAALSQARQEAEATYEADHKSLAADLKKVKA
ncbi:non-reducing end alpha-L-arabinofuranosidase family hydrolase [Brevundimonas sp.]|uniref:non-reducing end alpha-L-arabinofuranosidase family hydrolase n=1 Tax=Brevundimonas sp. TaxID=1871086 RepID=UPI002897F8FF|nr:non-reducing end alpha-L-arabinofuranosidase family hydrolase [Brevundimonas sp.]